MGAGEGWAEGRTRASGEQAWGHGFRPVQGGCGRRREQTRGATSGSGHDRPLRVLLSRPRPRCQERASAHLGVQSGRWGPRHRALPSVPSLRSDHGEHRGGRTCSHGGEEQPRDHWVWRSAVPVALWVQSPPQTLTSMGPPPHGASGIECQAARRRERRSERMRREQGGVRVLRRAGGTWTPVVGTPRTWPPAHPSHHIFPGRNHRRGGGFSIWARAMSYFGGNFCVNSLSSPSSCGDSQGRQCHAGRKRAATHRPGHTPLTATPAGPLPARMPA